MSKSLSNTVFQGLRTFLPPAVNFAASMIVVKKSNLEVWGEFIAIIIVVNLFSQVTNFGHKDPVQRSLSKQPGAEGEIWWTWLWTRVVLLTAPIVYFLVFSEIQDLGLVFSLLGLLFFNLSFQVLVAHRRAFDSFALIDLAASAVYLVLLLFVFEDLSMSDVLMSHVFYLGVRCVLSMVALRDLFSGIHFKVDYKLLVVAFPFFLALIGGFLNSKVDLIFLIQMDDEQLVGRYHVVTNLLIQAQVLAGVVLVPISKYLYRLPWKSYKKLLGKMFALGALAGVIVAVFLPFVLSMAYDIGVGWSIVIPSILFVIPPFVNGTMIYWFYSRGKESLVVWLNFAGVAFHVLGLAFFYDSLNLNSVLWISGLSKVSVACLYTVQFISMRKKVYQPSE